MEPRNPFHPPSEPTIQKAVREALLEDVGTGDATTLATIPPNLMATARLVAREPLVVCGLEWAAIAFHACCRTAFVQFRALDGTKVPAGFTLLEIRGQAAPLLTAERTALNFVQRLSGISTLTSRYVQAVAGTNARILDTRKTTPGWRSFEKYAVRCGGGANHRQGLHDQILIKDNHRVALANEPGGAIAAAVQRSRKAYPNLKVEVEADTLDEVQQAVAAGADIILLDNMSPALMKEAVELVAGRSKTEASGGITLESIPAVAATGVDYISVGALTHSARSMDLSLDFVADNPLPPASAPASASGAAVQ